ncbi:hypothetical protein PAXINDRAFT_87551 [Paxillus involutus ATCC 200175]|uniref:Uncharacterized protein n=1 Tax=Paxillus involutus ATCC 200175 TaxID=664439 RepID=A0A0C9T0V3_PAXIN|nr:hypothetical protein PAXINDRAFT_87551 [Paxillus involutus ATCC 200175]
MRSLSSTQKNTILTRLDSGCSAHTIASTTGLNVSIISIFHAKEHSDLQKSNGNCLSKLSPANVHHAIHLISTHRAKNAVQVTKSLTNIINQPLHPNTVCQHLNKTGMKVVVK